jgi:hypothetical protein
MTDSTVRSSVELMDERAIQQPDHPQVHTQVESIDEPSDKPVTDWSVDLSAEPYSDL